MDNKRVKLGKNDFSCMKGTLGILVGITLNMRILKIFFLR